ncbi:MAG: carboxypeptidase-like regulatory domain-containing protein [Chloroherpetonaceae bacterium]
MKHRLFLLAFALLISWLNLNAQVQLALNIRTPAPPNFSTWVNDPTVAQVIVVNATSQPLNNVAISFRVNDVERGILVANSKDGNPSVPRFNVPAGATLTLFGRNVFSESGTNYNAALLQSAITSNSFPEGNYEFCISLINAAGQELASAPCRPFIILNPDPPTLIAPDNHEEISAQALPMFRWTLVQNLSAMVQGAQISYSLRVAPVFAGQTPRVALENNPLLLNQSGISATSFQMLPSSPQFSLYPQAVMWAWQVQALLPNGTPAARNEGRSEIFVFRRRVLPPPVQLISPSTNEQVDGNQPIAFRWSRVGGLAMLQDRVVYSVKIAPRLPGESAESAINKPAIYEIGNLRRNDSLFLTMPQSTARAFVWQVTARDENNMPATENNGKSPIGRFELRELPPGPSPLAPNNIVFPHDSLPSFTWIWSNKPSGMVRYLLRITPIYRKSISPQGDTLVQTASEALSQNAPLRIVLDSSDVPLKTFRFAQSGTTIFNLISSPFFNASQSASTFLAGVPNAVGFAWDVFAVNAQGQSISQRSSPMRFRVSPPPINTGIGIVDGGGVATTLSRLRGRLVYNYAGGNPRQSPTPDKAFRNERVKLMLVEYDAQSQSQNGMPSIPKDYPSMVKTLATTETDNDGNFVFEFVGRDSMKLHSVQGTSLTKIHAARVVIENPYFVSPNVDLFIQPGERIDLATASGTAPFINPTGALRAQVKTVQWTYSARTQNGNLNYLPNSPIANAKVYVFRKPDAPFVRLPADERRPINLWRANIGGLDVAIAIDSAVTNQQGEATFRLIRNDGSNPKDCYYFFSLCDTTRDLNYVFQAARIVSDTAIQGGFTAPTETYTFVYPSIPTRTRAHIATARAPKILGEIYIAGEGNMNTPISNATLTLVKSTSATLETVLQSQTNAQGDFVLNVPTNAVESNAVWTLTVAKQGFSPIVMTVSNDLRRGLNLNIGRRFLNPRATVRGRIIDAESNAAVRAHVSSDSVATVLSMAPTESFEIRVPAGNSRRIEVQPLSPDYFPETITRNLQSGQTVDLGQIGVFRKAFRVEVTTQGETGIGTNSFLPLSGLAVEILPLNSEQPIAQGVSGNGGKVRLTFQNASANQSLNAQFRIRVSVPSTNQVLSLERRVLTTTLWQSKTFIPVAVNLKRGGTVSGVVQRISANNLLLLPVENAKVRVVQGGAMIEATTNAQGQYTLRNVPTGVEVGLQATLPNSQLVGADTTVRFVAGGAANQTRNFTLRTFSAMDVTKLLGFEIETRNIRQNSNGTYRLEGAFRRLRNNSVFMLEELGDVQIPFVATVVPASQRNADGRPFMRPTTSAVITDVNALALKVHHLFEGFGATLRDGASSTAGIAVRPDVSSGGVIDSLNGMIQGEVELNVASIQSNHVAFISKPYLFHPQGASVSERRRWTAIKSTPNALNFASIPIAQYDGRSLEYALHGFRAFADSSTARLRYNPSLNQATLELPTRLMPTLDRIGTVNLNVGVITVRRNGVDDVTRLDTLEVRLSPTWRITASQWSLRADNGLRLQVGRLNLGAVVVPFVGMHILPNRLETAGGTRYEYGEMNFVGAIKIKTEQNSVAAFGYDGGEQKWAFTIGTTSGQGRAAFIDALPKMAASDKISINNLSVFSDGTQQVSLDFSSHFTLYNRFRFSPRMLYATGNTLNIAGEFDLRIPTLNPQSTRVEYAQSSSSQISNPRVVPFGAEFKPNAVKAVISLSEDVSKWRIDDNGFFAYGAVVEEGVFAPLQMKIVSSATQGVKIELLRQNENGLTANQRFNISQDASVRLDNLSGGMSVQSNAWTKLAFTGKPIGQNGKLEGIEQETLTFVVTGDVELSPNQGLKISNYSTPLGDLTMIFDHRKGMMHGSLSLNAMETPAYHIKGGADLRIDRNGFFFAADAYVDLKSAGFGFNTAVVLGKYPNIKSVSEITRHFKQSDFNFTMPPDFVMIPNEYNNLAGFYLIGQVKDFIIPLPELDLNLSPVVRVRFNIDYGLLLGLGMNFSSGATLTVKGAAFVSIEASAHGSIGLVCAGASLGMGQVAYLSGTVTNTPSLSVSAGMEIVFYGSFYVGGGCCDSDCGSCDLGLFSLPCYKASFGPANYRYAMLKLVLETNPRRFSLLVDNSVPIPSIP